MITRCSFCADKPASLGEVKEVEPHHKLTLAEGTEIVLCEDCWERRVFATDDFAPCDICRNWMHTSWLIEVDGFEHVCEECEEASVQ